MSDSKKKTKSAEADATKKAATLAKAEAVNVEVSLASLTKTSLTINETLANLGKDLIAKNEELDSVTEAIKYKKEELKELHGADKVLMTISELEVERERIEAENEQLRSDKEVERQREQADYDYNLAQRRKADNDAWQEQVRLRGNIERDKTEAFEKDLKIRTEALVAKEQDYNTALEKLKSFDETVAKEVKAEVGKQMGMAQARFDADKKLNDVTNKAENDGLRKDIAHRDSIIASKDSELASLRLQLEKAIQAQTELAAKTVEGANDKKSLADMQGIVATVGGNGARART